MSQNIPQHLRYTKEHEWASLEGDLATIGITDYAQSQLGDIVFVELPDIGQELRAGASFGVVESIKSVSDLYAPLTGEVVERNDSLEDAPEGLNRAPYETWLIRLRLSHPEEWENLLDSQSYADCCK